jgi:hypothetical protein
MDNENLGAIALGVGAILSLFLLYEILTRFKKERPDVDKIEAKYSPVMNQFAAGREAGASRARTELLSQQVQEMQGITNLAKSKIDYQHQPEHHHLQSQVSYRDMYLKALEREENHKAILEMERNREVEAKEASRLKLNTEVYRQLILEQNKHGAELFKKEMMDSLDNKKALVEGQNRLSLTFDAQLRDDAIAAKMMDELMRLYEKQAEIENENSPEHVKEQKRKLIQKTIEMKEKGYERRLLQITNGGNVFGAHEDSQLPGDSEEIDKPDDE